MIRRLALTLVLALPLLAQSTFTNPGEVASHDGKLRAVVMLSDADRTVPNIGVKHLRYYQGWDPATPKQKAPADVSTFSPGPTLRARVGDKVEIMFLNTVNDANFSYTRVNAGEDGDPQAGCDSATNPAQYPAKDVYPNCFHGSSTANIHFHGTHTNPDGLGDNVLVQVMPDKNTSEKDWAAVFQQIFDKPVIPQRWGELPADYRTRQEKLVKARGEGMWDWNAQMIAAGEFPQYFVGAFPNVFEIPDLAKNPNRYKAGQAPGTHWYHAHKHGSTSLHSLNGMAGMFIIEGPYDDYIKSFYKLGAKYGNFEKVFVFQLVNPDQNLARASINFAGVGPGLMLVNGQSNPTLKMKTGEVQLWRMVNASNGATFTGFGPGVVDGALFTPTFVSGTQGTFTFKQTARDGVQFSPTNYGLQPFLTGLIPYAAGGPTSNTQLTPGLVLAGGNRADVLVQAPSQPGVYQFATTGGGNMFTVTVEKGTPSTPSPAFPVACPTGTTGPQCWPLMPTYLADLPPQQEYPHQVTFGWDAEPGRNEAGGVRLSSSAGLKLPPRYTIDNKQFEQFGPLIDQCMPLDDTQDWVLLNQTTVTHPFHIHVNPFQIIKIEAPVVNAAGDGFTYTTYAPANNYIWQDVVAIPSGVTLANGQFVAGKVTIRHRFPDFTGTYVLHCHILAHEDRGMMQLVRIVPAAKYPGNCQTAIPHHH